MIKEKLERSSPCSPGSKTTFVKDEAESWHWRIGEVDTIRSVSSSRVSRGDNVAVRLRRPEEDNLDDGQGGARLHNLDATIMRRKNTSQVVAVSCGLESLADLAPLCYKHMLMHNHISGTQPPRVSPFHQCRRQTDAWRLVEQSWGT